MKELKKNYNPQIDNDCVEIIPTSIKIRVSAFRNCYTSEPCSEGRLITWLTMDKFKGAVIAYRKCKDPKKRKSMKRNLPGITPSGIFIGKRRKENLQKHSGMVCIDIDADPDHPRSGDEWHLLIRIIADHFDSLFYGGLSLSGHGIYLIFRIADPTKHREHLNSLMTEIEKLTGLKADRNCMDITRLRLVSYDKKAYFNTYARAYTKILDDRHDLTLQETHKRLVTKRTVAKRHKTYERVMLLIRLLKLKKIDITKDYKDWFAIGCALASEYGASGLPLFQAVSSTHLNYNSAQCAKQYRQCLDKYHAVRIATFFYICKKNGITFK